MNVEADEEVIAVVRASPGRRVLGVGSLGALGLMLLLVALFQPPANPVWLVFLLVTGGAALWLADATRRATVFSVELTRDEIRCSNGDRIAAIADIDALDRGVFAFKPSNGFLMKLKTTGPLRWQPGLWWRIGPRVGVGGVTAAAQAKAMADIIVALKADGQHPL